MTHPDSFQRRRTGGFTRRRLLAALGVAGLLAGTTAWWRGRSGSRNLANLPPTATGPWVAFGDSLTEGVGAATGHDYPARLGARLGVTIENHGRAGDTTAAALGRLDAVTALRPRVVLLCLGGNDILQQQPFDTTVENLGRIIDRCQAVGSFVVLIGVRTSALRDRHEPRLAALAEEKRVLYVPDILRNILFDPALMTDSVHPNDAGYDRMAARLESSLKPRLPRLR